MRAYSNLTDKKTALQYISELKDLKSLLSDYAMNELMTVKAYSEQVSLLDDIEMFIMDSQNEFDLIVDMTK